MTHVCSVILIRRSFDIYHEQHKISLHNESIVLLEKKFGRRFCVLFTGYATTGYR
ncbi:HTH-type transcriptional regulator gadW [Escherichia coli ISC7]|uniref:HTH-type transcriptional regulator gadW n=1 Tax=Escherichia coli ISC7 TaxID=1432555 RepID=W1ERQ7_ECOLX|nr:HTH-type transcriptional regulator gadW [Escherichia coli ISC7]